MKCMEIYNNFFTRRLISAIYSYWKIQILINDACNFKFSSVSVHRSGYKLKHYNNNSVLTTLPTICMTSKPVLSKKLPWVTSTFQKYPVCILSEEKKLKIDVCTFYLNLNRPANQFKAYVWSHSTKLSLNQTKSKPNQTKLSEVTQPNQNFCQVRLRT